jgi:acyl-CoA oxidase
VIETHAIISALKPYTSALTQFRLQQFRELMGGHGYSRYSLLGGLRNNNDINTTWEGDNTVLVQQTAKFILENFRNHLKGNKSSLNYPTLKFLDKFENSSAEKIEINDKKDLDDVNLLSNIFEHRINTVLQKAVQRLATEVGKKNDLIVSWNNSQVFYIQILSKCYIENFVFDSFRQLIENIDNLSTKNMMLKFLKLYSLVVFDNDIGSLRNEDYISSDAVYVIKDEILSLCDNLKDELIGILDIIAAPDEILNCPLGFSNGTNYDSYFNKILDYNNQIEKN